MLQENEMKAKKKQRPNNSAVKLTRKQQRSENVLKKKGAFFDQQIKIQSAFFTRNNSNQVCRKGEADDWNEMLVFLFFDNQNCEMNGRHGECFLSITMSNRDKGQVIIHVFVQAVAAQLNENFYKQCERTRNLGGLFIDNEANNDSDISWFSTCKLREREMQLKQCLKIEQ